jgi:hypothetical protein
MLLGFTHGHARDQQHMHFGYALPDTVVAVNGAGTLKVVHSARVDCCGCIGLL